MRSGHITRYVLRELFGPTALGLALYTFVLLMNHFFLVAERTLAHNLGPDLAARLFLVGIPKLLIMSVPMAVLLGTLIALGRIAADREWVALQAAGQGPWVLVKPVLLHGLAGAVVTFAIYAWVVPRTHFAVRNLTGEIFLAGNMASDIQPRVFHELPGDAVLYVDEIASGGERVLRDVLFIQPDTDPRSHALQLVLARSGRIYAGPDSTGVQILDLYDGWAHVYGTDQADKYDFVRFGAYEGRRIEPARFLAALLDPPNKLAQDLSLPELWAEIGQSSRKVAEERDRAREDAGAPRGALVLARFRLATTKVELHQRVALPLASLCFALLALPMGLRGARSGKGAGFAMSVVVILVYKVVFELARNQSVAGRIPAEVGPSLANAVMLAWAGFLFWRMRRADAPSGGPAHVGSLVRSLSGRLRAPRRPASPADEPASDLVALGGTTRRFVGRLDRYVGTAYLRMLGFALASGYAVYALVELQDLMDSVLRTGQPVGLVLSYYQYFAPGVLPIVLPISCLVGAIVTFTLLARTSELVAIKASGVSMRRATLPVLLLTTFLCGLLFLVQDRIAPASNRKAQETRDLIMKRAPRTHRVTATGAWTFGSQGSTLYHYRLYDPDSEEFQGLSALTLDRERWRIVEHRFAERARWRDGRWELKDGWTRALPLLPAGEPLDPGSVASPFEEVSGPQDVALDLPRHIVREKLRLRSGSEESDDKSLAELREQIAVLSNSGYDITSLLVAYHGRFAHSASPLVMVLLGLPFAFRVGRRGSLYGIGVALLLVLVYWATFAIFRGLGLETLFPPYVAAWAPNLLFGLLGIYLLLYVET
jgi:LPS export ABC transporter permease LptG/LPS export ABC transporter permease LptF